MYKKFVQNNGLKIVVSPMPHMASVSLGLWIGVGGRYESAEKSGISHLIEHMLFKGSAKYTAKTLKQSIEGVGGALNGFTADEATCYMVKVPAKYLLMGLDILKDMVFDPVFDPEELQREKYVICEEIKMYKDQPHERVHEMLEGLMWPDHPLGRQLTGTIKTVKRFTRDEVISFKKEYYHPSNMAIIATGKIDEDVIVDYISSNIKGKRRKQPGFDAPKMDQDGMRLKFVKGDHNQAHIAFGFHAEGKKLKHRFALKLLSVILGGNMSSRLFDELREKYGLCYDISSSYKRHKDAGEFIIHAGVDSRKTAKSVTAVLDELKKIRDLGITSDELARAKEFAKGQFQLAMESTNARMIWLGDRLTIDGTVPDTAHLLKEIDNIKIGDVNEMCRKLFISSKINFSLVGDITAKDKKKIKEEVNIL